MTKTDLVALLSERAAQHPERVALRFLHDGERHETVLSYGELDRRARALAARLLEHTRAGERALLLYPSGPEYVTALLGCFYAGVVAVPAYPPQSLKPQHVGRIVAIARDARPSLLLTERMLLAPLTMVKSTLPDLAQLALLATDDGTQGDASFTPRSLGGEALAFLQYTSGSTSTPKGVMLTHGNLMANEAAIKSAFSIQDDDVIVSWLPLFHDMGLIGTLLQPLYAGVSAVLMAPQHFMERPRRWLEAITRYRGTVSGAPDFAYRLCVQRASPQQGSELDLSSWRLAFCGAEPVRAATLHAFADKYTASGFDARALYPCYGLAEATLLVTGGERGDGLRTRRFDAAALKANRAQEAADGQGAVSCGVVRAQHQVVIADVETGAGLPEGSVGEITVAGPSVAHGYWRNEEASAHAFADRVLKTGDLGFLHQGELFVTGRKKDMIIVRGMNLYPQDIERAIEDENEAVRKGRVIAFGLEHAGEEGIAVVAEVSPRVQKLIDPAAVCAAVSELVARQHGEPAALVALVQPGSVPITSSGKLQRAACKARWLARELDVFALAGPASV
ncbi:MAG: fatty acyl-AMP ligase [Polyangiales bacterium]